MHRCKPLPSTSGFSNSELANRKTEIPRSPRRGTACQKWVQTLTNRPRRSSMEFPHRQGAKANHDPDFASPLESFLQEQDEGLCTVLLAFQDAVKRIAQEISNAGLRDLFGKEEAARSSSGRDDPKKLDTVANDILKSALSNTGVVAAMASEEDEDLILLDSVKDPKYVAVFDPLDGSSNIDACIPTGTIVGIYPATGKEFPSLCYGGPALLFLSRYIGSRRTSGHRFFTGSEKASLLQPGVKQVAAAYGLYSSATMLVLSCGSGVLGFTLDSLSETFLLTHRIEMPARGQIYSLNDARQFDWPPGLRSYIDAIRQGRGQTGKQYSARYICSLVADFHRTLLYGGWAGNPRSHLRLLYEANPLSYLAEQAGGKGSTGVERILTVQPESLHQRIPVFLGSPEDILELESYDNVQQLGDKRYAV